MRGAANPAAAAAMPILVKAAAGARPGTGGAASQPGIGWGFASRRARRVAKSMCQPAAAPNFGQRRPGSRARDEPGKERRNSCLGLPGSCCRLALSRLNREVKVRSLLR